MGGWLAGLKPEREFSFTMNKHFPEKFIEDIIFNTPQEKLRQRGLEIGYDAIFRQVNLGAYGILDILLVEYEKKHSFIDRRITITIMELKNEMLTSSAFFQALRYVKGIQTFIKETYSLENTDIDYNIIVCGPDIDRKEWIYLTDYYKNFYLYTFNYDFDGVHFQREEGYHLSSPKYPERLCQNCINSIKKIIKNKINGDR